MRWMFVVVFIVFLMLLWFIIGLKWRIKAWGWIPIFLFDEFGTSTLSPNMDLRIPYLLQKYVKRIKKIINLKIQRRECKTLKCFELCVPIVLAFWNLNF